MGCNNSKNEGEQDQGNCCCTPNEKALCKLGCCCWCNNEPVDINIRPPFLGGIIPNIHIGVNHNQVSVGHTVRQPAYIHVYPQITAQTYIPVQMQMPVQVMQPTQVQAAIPNQQQQQPHQSNFNQLPTLPPTVM